MKKKLLIVLFVVCTMLLGFGIVNVSAATYGDLTYVISNGEVTITNCSTSVTSVTIPSEINGYPVTSIGDEAFDYCSRLTSISIPDSVTSIGDEAFYRCSSLTSISIPDSVTSIGYYAFSGTGYYNKSSNWENDCLYMGKYLIGAKDTIENCTIKDGTKVIADAFRDCSSLTSISIPDSVTSIGDYAFYNCSSLTSISIPDSVTSIGDDAFGYCSSLTGISIPDSVTSIGDFAFSFCSSLTSISIPDSVTSIGEWAFYSCESLRNITIPDGVTSIGGSAFSWCSSLTSISIPDSVTSIGEWAFAGCRSLTSISIPDSVTSIGYYAFAGCSSLTSISIPDSVTSIGDGAFDTCKSLTSITIGDSVTSIEDSAFAGCISLTSITVNEKNSNYSSDEYGILYNKDKTTLIQYPIGNERTSITIGDSVTSIGDDAFSGCESLRNISIPDSVTSIGYRAFYSCDSLTSITIGDSVTSIEAEAFLWCDSLTSITIGDSVTSIGDRAFDLCRRLTDVNYNGDEISWNNISIGGDNSYLTNAKRNYFWYVTYKDENDTTISKDMVDINSVATLPKVSGYVDKFYTDKDCTVEFDKTTKITKNTELYVKSSGENALNALFGETDNACKFNVTFNKDKIETFDTATLVVALFNGNGFVKLGKVPVSPKDETLPVTVETTEPVTRAKIILWTDFTTMESLSKATEMAIQ